MGGGSPDRSGGSSDKKEQKCETGEWPFDKDGRDNTMEASNGCHAWPDGVGGGSAAAELSCPGWRRESSLG
jgi:hypothetical protein